MRIPTMDKLRAKIPSKYSLVIVTAKRARQLKNMPDLDFDHGDKPILKALEEIAAGEIHYKQRPLEHQQNE